MCLLLHRIAALETADDLDIVESRSIAQHVADDVSDDSDSVVEMQSHAQIITKQPKLWISRA